MLVNGQWQGDAQLRRATDNQGRFVRQESQFRHWVTPDGAPGPSGASGFRAEPGRYHLYVALNCPWACRTLVFRKLKKLDDVISVSIAVPTVTEQGYSFGTYPGSIPDPLFNITYVHELYTRADPHYTGRATVPVLWDKQHATIVNNESSEIIRMFNSAFDAFGDASVDFYPIELRSQIEILNAQIYDNLNNGVYRAGFATTQEAYEEAVTNVFACLNDLEARLAGQPYLLGERITETDWRAFMTLIRFDVAYHGLFKCNLRRIADYPRLSAYLKRLYDVPGVAETVHFHHIKRTYYSIARLNPNGIVPQGPEQIFAAA
ncbi:MAG: glutathione S-transferase family protein [Deltaproteobacteria bacterium]|nr:glutathione S-transferase family protein [Deltaproteobacteria bacterium]